MRNILFLTFFVIISVIGFSGCCCSEQELEKTVNGLSGFLAEYYFDQTETSIKDIVIKNPDITTQEIIDKLINEKKTVADKVNYTIEPGEEVLMLETEGLTSIKMSYYYEFKLFKSKLIDIK